MGLKYNIEDEDWEGLPEATIEGVKAGLKDVVAGRVHTHEYVMAKIEETLKSLRSNNG